MKTSDLIDQIAQSTDRSKTEVREVLDALLDGIPAAAKKGEDVTLTGFGKFSIRQRAARQGRNPATGESIEIPGIAQAGLLGRKGCKRRPGAAEDPREENCCKDPSSQEGSPAKGSRPQAGVTKPTRLVPTR